jgi:hypothetical protein
MSRAAVLAGALVLAALVAFAALAGDFGGGEDGAATLWITRDEGRLVLHDGTVPAGLTALQALDRSADIETRYGGRFVQSIDGLAGSAARGDDWFYFVNGVLADRSAAEYRLRDGDVLWWDFRRWTGSGEATAVVGAFPEPFLRGYAGRSRPAHVRYAAGHSPAARALGRVVRAVSVRPLGIRVPTDANAVVVSGGTPSVRLQAAGPEGPYRLLVRGVAGRLARRPELVRRHYAWPR